MSQRIRILSYNIHKGFTFGNLKYILDSIKKSIQAVHADIVCLQEVIGDHTKHSSEIENWPVTSQFEFLADNVWNHYAYGKNAVYTDGHHGNAVLSKFPIADWNNQDISLTPFENRGVLHAILNNPEKDSKPIHVFCVHLSLLENDRKKQLQIIAKNINENVPADEPLIIAGDFNDWRQNASAILFKSLGMNEVSIEMKGKHLFTFPSMLPFFALDRIYYRNIKCVHVEVLKKGIWNALSDHLPLVAEFEI
ncbi:MAG: endonuclease/exonuclease/phosphatase family protein [Pseudobdellovibrio sp.]